MLHELNYFCYRFKYRFGKILPLTSPVDVSLELAALCNQSCGYCYWSKPKELPFPKGTMSFDTAAKIIRQAADLGVPSLKMNWKGESTLNKDFAKITAYAKKHAIGGTFVDRLTNSNFKFKNDREDIFDGLCNQTKVKISFDSFIPEVFEKQRAGAIYGLAVANIDKFYNHPNRKNTEIVIQAVRTNLNKDEDIEGESKKRWPEAKISIRDVVGGRVEKDISEYEHRSRDNSDRQSCLQAHVRVIFSAEGKAFPCCPDIGHKLCIGDIKTQSLKEIFNSAEAIKLRKSLKDKSAFQSDPCKNCSSFETYKGFRPNWNS